MIAYSSFLPISWFIKGELFIELASSSYSGLKSDLGSNSISSSHSESAGFPALVHNLFLQFASVKSGLTKILLIG